MSKIDLPITADAEVITKAIAELTARQQERIDRLSRMIYFIRDYVVKGITPTMIEEDTVEDALMQDILNKVDELRGKEKEKNERRDGRWR